MWNHLNVPLNRRSFLARTAAGLLASQSRFTFGAPENKKAQIAITFDLEMSRHYPTREMMEWDYQKGNLNEETKQYSLKAAQIASELNGVIHFFCVGRVLEQKEISWLQQIHELGHPVGNHTYDHVNVWATKPEQTQFRFQRSPWLVKGMTAPEIIRQNIRTCALAMKQRLGFAPEGFRTPGGSYLALNGREDIQQMLLDEGYTWVSSQYPNHQYTKKGERPTAETFDSVLEALKKTQPYVYPTGLVEIPMSPIGDVGAFRTSYWKRDEFLYSIERCVKWCIANGAVFDFLCHPSIMYVEDPDFESVKLICKLVKEAGDKAELVGLSKIAENVKAT